MQEATSQVSRWLWLRRQTQFGWFLWHSPVPKPRRQDCSPVPRAQERPSLLAKALRHGFIVAEKLVFLLKRELRLKPNVGAKRGTGQEAGPPQVAHSQMPPLAPGLSAKQADTSSPESLPILGIY